MRPLCEIQGVILDLDGTVYRGDRSILEANTAVERMLAAGLKVIYLSNNASDTRADVTAKLSRNGLPTAEITVVTGTSLLASYLKQHSSIGRVLIVGEPGLAEEIAMVGWEGVMAGSRAGTDNGKFDGQCDGKYDAVAVGCDRYFTYEKLNEAYQAISRGAILVATDRDSTYPTEWGAMPGTGAVLAGIEAASDTVATLAGKPCRFAAEHACTLLQIPADKCLIVGDRLDSDIALGRYLGASALVLTGVTTADQAAQSVDAVPDMVFNDLSAVVDALIDAHTLVHGGIGYGRACEPVAE